jgi:hypothetical protein
MTSPVQPAPESPIKAAEDAFTQTMPPPRIEDLWRVADQRGPMRPWTVVELGQAYYGAAYQPALREEVEYALKEATPYFKQRRIGAQPTYQPRTSDEFEQLLPLTQLTPSEIVIVQGQKGTPQIALVLSAPQEGTVSLVADQWKQANRPLNVIQLVPGGMTCLDLVTTPAEHAKQYLQTWRQKIDEEWVDLIAWWERCQGQSFTYAERCRELASESERLALGLELLARGDLLFRREGMTWTPLDAQRVLSDQGIAHHLDLVHAGAGTPIQINGRRGTLTGRSNWRFFEVRWEEGERAGKLTQVRSGNIQLLPKRDR